MPDRQRAVLEFLLEGRQSIFVYLPDRRAVRKAAREYRDTIANQPDKEEIVRLLDALVAKKILMDDGTGKIIETDEANE